jgi:PAS domain S-box-containing protein
VHFQSVAQSAAVTIAIQHVAELDRSSQQSARILDAAHVGVIYVDLEGRITFANPWAANLMNYSVDELRGQPIRTHMQLSSGAASAELIQAAVVPRYLPFGQELCWRGDGTSFPIEYESAALGDAGQVEGTVITFRDITRRRAVERLKDELISVVSHELRTPLTAIRSSLGLLVSGMLGAVPARGQRMLEIAMTNTDRLIRLVNEILDLERVNSGEVGLQHIRCDAGELMCVAADGVRSMADDAGVILAVLPREAHLWGDPDRLVQVLTNLLSNAIKFSPSTGGTVWVEVEESDGEVLFRVRDEGRGIPADKLESIFDRFAQVHASDAREKGGTGLGLAICRGIVDQHRGHIWAESTLGAGTTLCVALPTGETDASPDQSCGN